MKKTKKIILGTILMTTATAAIASTVAFAAVSCNNSSSSKPKWEMSSKDLNEIYLAINNRVSNISSVDSINTTEKTIKLDIESLDFVKNNQLSVGDITLVPSNSEGSEFAKYTASFDLGYINNEPLKLPTDNSDFIITDSSTPNKSTLTTKPILTKIAQTIQSSITQSVQNIGDAAQVPLASLNIKNNINEKFKDQLQGNSVTNVEIQPFGNYTPVRYQIVLTFTKNVNISIPGYKNGADVNQLISVNPIVSSQLSDNVKANQASGYRQGGLFYKKEIGEHSRTPCTTYYQTELETLYGSKGFMYPGYNCNYESSESAVPNGYLTIDGQRIDFMQKVMDETVAYTHLDDKKQEVTEQVTYSNPGYILSEIQKGTFKKHPAAKNFYEQNVTDATLAVDTEFIVSSAVDGMTPLGLYAPAGEVMKLQFDKETVEKMKLKNPNIQIIINDNYWRNKARGNSGQISNRYPHLMTTFDVDVNQLTEANNYTFEFGTPFGGSISIICRAGYLENSDEIGNGDWIKFKVLNAVKSLAYFDGFTTLEDWNKQIEDVRNNKITSPIIDFTSYLYGAHIPFTDTINKVCVDVPLDNFVYPKEICGKWNDFLSLSNYYSKYSSDGRVRRLDMKFCDDIWDSAAAFGGSMIFYCPIRWGAGSFLKGGDPINISNWGVLHEINHNFENDNAFFNLRSHPGTNTVNLFDLSVISDAGKYRNEINIDNDVVSHDIYSNPKAMGWPRLSSPFETVVSLKPQFAQGWESEWSWYGALLYTLGPQLFSQLAIDNANDFPNKKENTSWSPVKEIIYLSDYLKTNIWDHLCKMSPKWNSIPKTYNYWPWPMPGEKGENGKPLLTKQDEKQLNALSKYPTIDFMANLYACSQYFYDSETKTFKESYDSTTSYQIPAFQPYTFQFDKYIISQNNDFDWDRIDFPKTTKLGGTLETDPNNPKNVIYTPNSSAIKETDEFDVTIYPSNFKNKPKNYVPAYKWKIKVRQNVNKPLITSYLPFERKLSSAQCLDKVGVGANKSNQEPPIAISTNPLLAWNKTNTFSKKDKDGVQKQGAKVEFNFIVPEDGEYQLYGKWDDGVRLVIDDEEIYQSIKILNDYTPMGKSFNWTKGQVVNVKLGLINAINDGHFAFEFRKLGAVPTDPNTPRPYTPIDIMKNCVIPQVNTKSATPEQINDYVHSDLYNYKPREVNYSIFKSRNKNSTPDYLNFLPTTDYEFWNIQGDKKLKADSLKNSSGRFENWRSVQDKNGKRYGVANIEVDFNQPTAIASWMMESPNYWWKYIPTHYQIILVDNQGNEFDSGINVNTKRNQNYMVYDFEQTYNNIVKAKINLWEQEDDPSDYAIVIQSIRFLSEPTNLDATLAFNNPFISLNGQLEYKPNDDTINLSNVNGMYLLSSGNGDIIEFNLANCDRFIIRGRKAPTDGVFDVYVNDELVGQDVSCNADQILMNQDLFKYTNKSKADVLKVKIVNKSNKQLYFNSILTFGTNTSFVK